LINELILSGLGKHIPLGDGTLGCKKLAGSVENHGSLF
jgi:hypothetical protein